MDADLPRPKLQFVGSCRNEADEKRLQHLKDRVKELKLDSDVEFHKNVTYRSAIFSIHEALIHLILYVLIIDLSTASELLCSLNSISSEIDQLADSNEFLKYLNSLTWFLGNESYELIVLGRVSLIYICIKSDQNKNFP